MSTNPDHAVQLARILAARQRLVAVRCSPTHNRMSHMEERFAEDEERNAKTVFVAAEIAAHLAPIDVRYDGLNQLAQMWGHHFTELEAGAAYGGSFIVLGLDIDAAQIARARDEHRARFAVATEVPQ